MAAFTRHPEVVYTDLEDGAVLLHGETKFFYSLDHVGAAVWRLMDSADSVDGLIRRIEADYDVTPELARSSVTEFIGSLEREQLIAPRGEPGSALAEASTAPAAELTPSGKKPFVKPELLKHDEPLHAVVMNPFDPQLPLAE